MVNIKVDQRTTVALAHGIVTKLERRLSPRLTDVWV
jgi:hypothetical protein